MLCEKCSEPVHNPEKCDYCEKILCRSCVKSSKNPKKTTRTVICKACWGDMGKRTKYKQL